MHTEPKIDIDFREITRQECIIPTCINKVNKDDIICRVCDKVINGELWIED